MFIYVGIEQEGQISHQGFEYDDSKFNFDYKLQGNTVESMYR